VGGGQTIHLSLHPLQTASHTPYKRPSYPQHRFALIKDFQADKLTNLVIKYLKYEHQSAVGLQYILVIGNNQG